MKTICFVICLTILSADATLDQLLNKGGQGHDAPSNPLQRLFNKFGGGQGRVVNHSKGGKASSLHEFMHGHNGHAGCDGWIPMMSPSGHSGHGHSSGGVSSVDTSYGPPPKAPQKEYGPPQQHIQIPQKEYGPPQQHIQLPQKEYGPPQQHIQLPQKEYGPPQQHIQLPQKEYGPPQQHIQLPQKEYGPPKQPIRFPAKEYGPPQPPAPPAPIQIPVHSYGPPKHSSGAVESVATSYGPPQHIQEPVGHAEYGPPKQSHPPIPQKQYGPPEPRPIALPQKSYGPPVDHPLPPPPPQISIAPEQHYGPPQNSYGPPASGHAESHSSQSNSNSHIESHVIHGHSDHHADQAAGHSFDNAISLVTSSLGVSGNSEVIQSQAVHESHTYEVGGNSGSQGQVSLTNDYNGGDSYSAPPLDSYAPGKYEPSFLKPKKNPQQPPANHLPAPPPQQPAKIYLPQRPQPAPRPLPPPQRPPQQNYGPPANNYGPPKQQQQLIRPQAPPPSFRPHSGGHSHGQTQISHHGFVKNQPKQPLPHRPPVPHGLFQSIGKHVQALDLGNKHHNQQPVNNYLPPPAHELPIPAMKLVLPHPIKHQQFNAHGSSSSSSSSFNLNNNQLQNVKIIHDCPKSHLSQNYGAPQQNYGPPPTPVDSYGPPHQEQHVERPAESYGTPIGKPLEHYEPPQTLQLVQQQYEIPAFTLDIPQHNSVNFNSPSNSYGPPASGPAGNLDVIGLESQHRANSVQIEHQNLIAEGSANSFVSSLPGLDTGLASSGLEFASATKSHSIQLPPNGGPIPHFQVQLQSSISDQNSNSIDAPGHQTILADGLLESVLHAIEEQPSIPQVTEDQQTDHSEVKVFLNSPTGQDVLSDKPLDSAESEKSS